ncbi:serine protease [uncultured Flavobacterium sp.]|uniref:trypsin-like serine peptidase n=1 Tax=uncultured Flavobacterium sp. TaxID=165435 RepID=UPI0030CA36EF
MKKLTTKFLTLSLSAFSLVMAVIYGDFDAIEIEDIEVDQIDWQAKAKSVAVYLSEEDLEPVGNGYYRLNIAYTLQKEYPKLKKHPFLEQPAFGISTAFLVADDKLMTVGHADKNRLLKVVYIFDYEWDVKNKKLKKEIYHESEIYRCTKILTSKNNKRKGDYAVLLMDKKIKGKTPLKVRNINRKSLIGKDIVTIGSPDGVPLKFTKKGVVWEKLPYDGLSENKFFIHNLDVSVGSSGSPIFLKSTGEVIGIQSRGEDDYIETDTEMVFVQGDYDGKNSNLGRSLVGECGSLIPQKVINIINK